MQARWGPVVLVLAAALAGPAAATHDPLTVPLVEGDQPVDDALAWIADEHVRAEGCVEGNETNPCHTYWTKWVAVTVAHAGADPQAWPSEGSSVVGWLLDHTDDLRDEKLVRCQQHATDPDTECASDRVFSLAKATLAFEAAGEDAREVPLPDGGDRDLVAELLDEFDGTQFGRSEQANDDVWALIALNSVGYDGPEVDDAIQRIERAQGPGGGVSWGEAGTPSVDLTASAVMAVAPHDRDSFLSQARSYLADEQVEAGDRRACWTAGSQFSDDPNAESTARALEAVVALGEDPLAWSMDGQSPATCLLSFQDGGGFVHAEGGATQLMPTQQSLAALGWSPYGTLDAPPSTLGVTDQATVDEQHTATVPGGHLRLDSRVVDEHTWTPEETGQRVFHGYAEDPVRPVELVVDVQRNQESSSGSPGSSRSDNDPDRGSGGEQAKPGPEASLAVPDTAERNVSFTVHVDATPAEAPVTAFRLATPSTTTDWRPAGAIDVTLHQLGEVPLQAWARDAEGHVSEPAQANVTVVDAPPRITLTGPALVDRHEPATLTADARDPDGPPPNVTWTSGNRTATGPNVTFSFEDPGPHEVHAQALDEAGNQANATLTVQARNRPPTSLTVTPRVLEANATEVLHADAQDPEGDPLTVAWRPAGADEPTSWGGQLHLDTGPPGQRVVHVNVTDPHGGWTSARVELTVRDDPARDDEPAELATRSSPVVEAGASPPGDPGPARVSLPDTVEAPANRSTLLKGTAASPTGHVRDVTVALGGALEVRGKANFAALLPALPPGEYDVSARAQDADGWGPWTNATLVVHPEPTDEPVTPQSHADPREAPVGPAALLAALAAAAGRRSP